jgi:predicted RNA-binding Zn ribbon-like protein
MATRIRRPRQAERQARSAQHLGDRRRTAEAQGPLTVLPVAVDQLRAVIARLPESRRADAAARATQLLDQLRQSIAEN